MIPVKGQSVYGGGRGASTVGSACHKTSKADAGVVVAVALLLVAMANKQDLTWAVFALFDVVHFVVVGTKADVAPRWTPMAKSTNISAFIVIQQFTYWRSIRYNMAYGMAMANGVACWLHDNPVS